MFIGLEIPRDYVNEEGNVYSCCHEGPFIIGNIYEKQFEDIVNSDLILNQRERAIEGDLRCFSSCNLVPGKIACNIDLCDDKKAGSKFNVLKILFGEKCNINCIMCWQNSANRKIIDFNILEKKIYIHQFRHVILQGGEPFASKEALKYVDYVMEQGVGIFF